MRLVWIVPSQGFSAFADEHSMSSSKAFADSFYNGLFLDDEGDLLRV